MTAAVGRELTTHELAVLESVGAGMTDAEIAARFGLTVSAARARVKTVRTKLGARNRTHAVAIAAAAASDSAGIVPAPRPASVGQLAAFHAKCHDLDRAQGLTRGTSKARALQRAGERSGREVTSSTELSYAEAHEALDELEAEIEALETDA